MSAPSRPVGDRRVLQQRFRQLNHSRAQVLTETFRLRIDAGRRGHAFAKKAEHDEVQRPNIWQPVPMDFPARDLRHQLAQPIHGQKCV